ncbi:glycosyltransferase [Altericista sp. CCNU0014]|uniref:glycosyltransferase n=1 Tax=Altericista sp. CCNU0014 TaxID=3082949 RepID=UPI00384F6405
MATLILCIFNFQGEFNGSLNLAKKLQASGNQVYYLGVADSRERVQAHGFEFLTILEEFFPNGFFKKLDFGKASGYSLFLKRVAFIKSLKKFISDLIEGKNQEIQKVFQEIHPDLLIVSTTEGAYATLIGIIANAYKIPSIFLTDMFSSLPPSISSKAKNSDRDKPARESLLEFVGFKFRENFEKSINNINFFFGLDIDYKKAILDLSRKLSISSNSLDIERNVPLKLPHLILCPQDLELPNLVREDCHYAEASINLQREEGVHFDWSKLDPNKKIIYCSLGTTSGTYEVIGIRQILSFFKVLIDSVSLSSYQDQYQLVLVVSEFIQEELFISMPKNVLIFNKVPQLSLLNKSHLAIIAGGIHTIKECIFFGVPMIVFPVWADQFDNAERVNHHQLGLVSDIYEVSVDEMAGLIDKASSLFIKKNLERWKYRFREMENSNRSIDYIQSVQIGSAQFG